MGFSVAILISASLISSAMMHAQKTSRDIEDVNISFFAAEAGIEEALYYNSFHKKGFEALNELNDGNWEKLDVFEGTELIIPSVRLKWEIDARIDNSICTTPATQEKCMGSVMLGKSVTFNFSYDENTKLTTNDVNENHDNDGVGTVIKLAKHKRFDGALKVGVPNDRILTWLASFIDASDSEKKLLFQYTGDSPSDNDNDCVGLGDISNVNGFIFCKDIVNTSGSYYYENDAIPFTNPMIFMVDVVGTSAVQGFLDGNTGVLNNIYGPADRFFDTSNQKWRKVKFFFIQTIEGSALNPPLDKIYYQIIPDSEMTSLKTEITATGRSRNILSKLSTKIDNTYEFTALDYGALLE